MKILFIVQLLFLSLSAQAQWVARGSYDILESKNYRGSLLGAQIQYKVGDGSASLGARKLSRQYTGAEINENAYDLGGAYKLTANSYIEVNTSQAPNAEILPLETYSTAGHWLSGPADFGLGLSYSKYKLTEAKTIRPFYMYEFSDFFRAGAEIFWVHSDRASSAGHLFGSYDFKTAHTFRVDLAGGETLEDAGVHADFSSVSAEYGYRRTRWGIYFSVTGYDSNLRKETGYGVRVEVK